MVLNLTQSDACSLLLQAKEEKLLEAKASYNCWLEQKKTVVAKERKKKEMAEAEKAKKEEEEKRDQIKNAELVIIKHF